MADNKFLPKLSQNLLEILEDEDYYDITIEVGKDPNVKIFRAHMNILNYRSTYLKRILSTNKKKNDGILTHIKLPNISPEIFHIILRYIYGGRLSLKEHELNDSLNIIKVLIAANELNLQELILYLESFLIENKSNWMEQNFDLIYQISFENDSFLELQKYCTNLISKEPDKIFKSLNFSSISEKLLITIIQNNNLQMDEIQIWENVIKWGISQNPELPSDHTSYSKDDFNTLKNTLQQCIPFIRFHNLTSKEFSDKVLPYKKILSKELYKNLLKDFLDNNNKPAVKKSLPRINENVKKIHSMNINSEIISFQYLEIILKWINKLEIKDKLTTSYKFKLLFRGSFDDGFIINKCHEICCDQSHTITFIKLKDSTEILGGYNPIRWKFDNSFGFTKDSFIFSFKNNNYILSRVINENKAINNSSYYGLSFGDGDLCLYQTLKNLKIRCKKTYYEKHIRENGSFSEVVVFEVFQIV